jgi:hypothetical protein
MPHWAGGQIGEGCDRAAGSRCDVAREGVVLDPVVGIGLLRSLLTRMTLGVGSECSPEPV